jgi:hypothetical protein
VKLNVRHTFPCTLDVFWQMFWDDDYDRMLSESAGVTRSTLWDRTEGAQRIWRMRFTPDQELPSVVAKALGTTKLVYEQESRLDAQQTLHWDVFPAVVPDKVTARGTMRAVANNGGIDRIVDGEISVRIPIIGGRIEKTIHKSVMDSYERAAEVTLAWLDQRGLRLA